jgi:hypothetical protein
LPVELGLELVAPVGSDRRDAKRELLDQVVSEIDGALLIMATVDP